MTEEGNDGRVVVSPSLRMIGTSGFSGNLNPRREVKSMGKMARMLCKKYLDFDKFWKRKLELPKSGYPSEAGFRMLVSAAYLTLDYMKNWHRFKQVEPEFANAMYESFRNGWPHVATAVLSAMNDHQVYRITEGLVECLKVTKGCPTEWHRDQLVPPFRAVTFMLPKGAIVLPDGNSIDYVMTGIITEKELNSIGVETAQGNDTFMIVASSENQNCVYHTKLRFKDDDYLDLEPRMDYRDTVRDFGANLPWSVDEDKDVLFLVTDVVLMLLAILNGDKVPVTPARRIRTVKCRPPGLTEKKSVLFSPHVLGEGIMEKVVHPYHGRGEPTGRKVREHWRAGHWHTVLYGKGRSKRKHLWFPPCHVNDPARKEEGGK